MAALADARRRSVDCGREAWQCRFEVATRASGKIGVRVRVQAVDPSTRKCLLPVDADRDYEYSSTGVFESQLQI